MNTGNASGFLLFGVVMWILPDVAPDLFPRQSVDGSSARALWVQVMGLVQLAIGFGFLVQLAVWPRLTRWLATEPAMEPVWTRDPVPANAMAAMAALSEQSALFAAQRFEPNGVVALRGKYATLWGALKVAFLDEK